MLPGVIHNNTVNIEYYVLYKESDYGGQRGINWKRPKLLAVVLFGFNYTPPVITAVPEIIDPVFAKTNPKCSVLMTEYERFGLVSTKTRVYKFGHWREKEWSQIRRKRKQRRSLPIYGVIFTQSSLLCNLAVSFKLYDPFL
jgi:hypothetical protein